MKTKPGQIWMWNGPGSVPIWASLRPGSPHWPMSRPLKEEGAIRILEGGCFQAVGTDGVSNKKPHAMELVQRQLDRGWWQLIAESLPLWVWVRCPECGVLFVLEDDYLCKACRNV